ncbi:MULTISPECIES: hypothetical protein [Enterobacter]|uniref:hypothetical protein n=1 Tax=Enterobacter TaxID=547 RepID=UPI00129977C5|nr:MULTISPECIES: hypothetical protein [Enterobacter]MCI9497664.1 hypothetical protein [Enterobacter hormaechei subsp. steigerwaltii]ELD3428685.1 hypothetical protein [Enterobacter hormaechei]MCG0490400.1 hypothetical protein [Enterobacter hormaechei]MCG0532660.1 hypothetical protein [Enterobacter hormaechei]MCG0545560.1 hypothetical protein [Enterobacter hormaechei]
MQLTDIEKELLAGFVNSNWQDFIAFASEAVPESTLHKLAEKLGLSSKSPETINQ